MSVRLKIAKESDDPGRKKSKAEGSLAEAGTVSLGVEWQSLARPHNPQVHHLLHIRISRRQGRKDSIMILASLKFSKKQ